MSKRGQQAKLDGGVLSRARGCLLGQLAGDSLGSLVEFQGPDEIRRRHPEGLRELADGGPFALIAGQPTDDSELALALTRSLVGQGTYDEAAVVRGYVGWYESVPFDIGNTIGRALRAASAARREGGDPAEAAREQADAGSQANGALMRVSPLGIFGWQQPPEELAEWARRDARLTHPHQITQDINALFVVALAHAIATGPSPQELYEFTREWAAANGVPEHAQAWLTTASQLPPKDYVYQQGWVRKALQNAFYQLLHASSLEEGVVQTVMAGGHTVGRGPLARELVELLWRR